MSFEGSPGPRQTSPKHEIHHICMHARDLGAAQSFSYGFLAGPVAIHSSRTTSSKPTKSASPNEFINPEISMKHHRFSPYSFLGFGPAIFPGLVISSHACMVFLSETSSSSHVEQIIARQCVPMSSEGSPGPRQTLPKT